MCAVRWAENRTYPSYEPPLINPYWSTSENSKLVTPRAGGPLSLPFLPLGFPVSCAFDTTITGRAMLSLCRRSHTQIVPSRLPEHSISPSRVGSQATHLTVLWWCTRVCTCAAVPWDVSLVMPTVWSAAAVAMRSSERDHWTSKIPLLCG